MRNLRETLRKGVEKKQKFIFETKVGKLKGPSITLEKLEDMAAQNVRKWIERDRNVIKLTEITEEVASTMLELVIYVKYYNVIERKRSVETKLEALLHERYT